MEQKDLKLHPIQAIHIAPRELLIRSHTPPSVSLEYEEADFDLDLAHSDYNAEQKQIYISTRITIGSETPELNDEGLVKGVPFFLRVELVGIFQVNDTEFPADRILEWANTNAVFIMYPYMREHVYSLTGRVGFKPALLPLVEVPLFRMDKPKADQSVGAPAHPGTESTNETIRNP